MASGVNPIQKQVETIFSAAVEKKSTTERIAYLEGACGRDADLRMRVDALLDAHDEAGNFLLSATVNQPSEGPGSKIGSYKVLQEIGEGGFGVVYMAEQEEPIRRKVALKIIKLGMDTKQVIARFEAERQALALMEHPNIAKVFDAGATQSGRPYFVMELVKGIPITEYCDQNNLDTEERLRLFIDVCGAVQHAHRKGIIHRDLKPQNVMVTLHDGRPVPKVIDFGISKATNQRLTEKTLFTEYHQFIGTPQYMSPEQAEMSGLDIDTRSDVYSLGALLYELLTGTPPFETTTLQQAGYAEIQRIIREVAPPKPSTRLATLVAQKTEQSTALARHHGSEPRSLTRLIQGDLDWIVMKAMEKDRTRRYETALDLATDIQRHLNNEPVVAGAPSMSYQLRKFIQRHKFGVAASSAIVLTLLLGCALASIGFVQASRDRDAARESKLQADREAARSKAIADFLQDMLVATDAEQATALEIDVKKVVATAREVFGDDHATVAATLSSRAAQLQSAGNYEGAEPLLEESIRIWESHHGRNHINVGLTLSRLGMLQRLKGDSSSAEVALSRAIEIMKSHGRSETATVADALLVLADVHQNRGDYIGAERHLRESLRIRRKVAPHQSFSIAVTLNLLANVLAFAGKKDELETVLLECLAEFKAAMPNDSDIVAKISLGAGEFYIGRGDLDKAESYLREALRIYRKTKTPAVMYRDIALKYLSNVIRRRDDDSDKYIAVRTKFLQYVREQLASQPSTLASYLNDHARYLIDRKKPMAAIPLALEAIEKLHQQGDGKVSDQKAYDTLARATGQVGLDPDRSVTEYQQALAAAKTHVAAKPDDFLPLTALGMLQYRLGKYAQAIETASRQEKLDAKKTGVSLPACTAILAMAHFRLDQKSESDQALARMRRMMKLKKNASRPELRALAEEAETLIRSKSR